MPQATPRAGAMESARIGFATPRGLGGPGGKVGGAMAVTGPPPGRPRASSVWPEGPSRCTYDAAILWVFPHPHGSRNPACTAATLGTVFRPLDPPPLVCTMGVTMLTS